MDSPPLRPTASLARPLGTLLLGTCLGCAATGEGPSRTTYYLAPASYFWEEEAEGEQLLEETGSLGTVLGVGFRQETPAQRVTLELYGADVDYDGQLQDGTPYQTTVDYLGLRGELDLAFGDGGLGGLGPDPADDGSFVPYWGFGLESWSRDLNGDAGYVETWLTTYVHVGLDVSSRLSADSRIYADGSLGLSVLNFESVDLAKFGIGDVQLSPGPGPVLSLRVGWAGPHLSAGLFARARTFAESDVETVGGLGFKQPESRQRIVGIELAYSL